MDSRDYSLADFANIEGKDIMERADIFGEYLDDIHARHHLQYRRVTTSGSAPVIRVIDRYTGKERDMIYFASNDYLN
jgi:glycine C-acetyltransferase